MRDGAREDAALLVRAAAARGIEVALKDVAGARSAVIENGIDRERRACPGHEESEE